MTIPTGTFLRLNKYIKGSTYEVLQFTKAILDHGVSIGYDAVADFFEANSGKVTNAHCVWLLAEAAVLGRLEEANERFPEANGRAVSISALMNEHSLMDAINAKNAEQVRATKTKYIYALIAVVAFACGVFVGILLG